LNFDAKSIMATLLVVGLVGVAGEAAVGWIVPRIFRQADAEDEGAR
jgi:hypothetical protein